MITSVATLLILYLVATSPPVVALAIQGLIFPLLSDFGVTVDAIVVLGRGKILRNDRVETAIQLWQARRTPKIFASGMGDAPQMIELFKPKGTFRQILGGKGC